MDRITKCLFQSYKGTFFQADIQRDAKAGNVDTSKYRFKEITQDYLERDPIFKEKDRAQKFLNRLSPEHSCFGFFNRDDSIASYLWISNSKREITVPWSLSLRLILRPGTGYIWDCFTAVDYRRQGLYKNGLLNAKSILLERGVKRAYICCAKDNVYSKAGITSAGFREIFYFSGMRIGQACIIKKKNKIKVAMRGQAHDIIAG